MILLDWIKTIADSVRTTSMNVRREEYKVFQDWCMDNDSDYLPISKMLNYSILEIGEENFEGLTRTWYSTKDVLWTSRNFDGDIFYSFALPVNYHLNSLIELKIIEYNNKLKLTPPQKGHIYYRENREFPPSKYSTIKFIISGQDINTLFNILFESIELFNFLNK